MTNKDTFRICPTTGFKVFRSAETLIKVNAVAAVVFLLVGGLFGIALALTRWPAVQILPADWFYLALTAHGLDVLLVWIIFFEMAVLYFASSVLLGARLATPRIAWLAFALMLIGAVVTNVAVLQGESTVMFTSYVPMKAAPHFYLGILLFAVGALLGSFVFLGTLVVAKAEKTYKGSIPLVTFGALTAAIIAIFTVATGAIILIPTLLWSLGYISHIDTLMYKTIWWAMGHASQQINVSAHIAIWYLIAAMVFGAKPLSEKVSRMAFFMYILFLQLAAAHHLLVEPGLSPEWKIFNTSYAMYLAVLGSLIHGLTVPGSIEAAQRRKGYTNGLFEWLRKAPWSNPAFSGMFLSLLMFGILGGISQHHVCARALPRHGGGWHDARLHGRHLPAGEPHLPARADPGEMGPVAALRVCAGCHRHRRFPDGGRNPGGVATALGHDLRRRFVQIRIPGGGGRDDGPERHLRRDCGHRRRHVHHRRGRLNPGRQAHRRHAGNGADETTRGRGCRSVRQRGERGRARHGGDGRGVFHGLRPLLLRQLEVPVGDLAAAVTAHMRLTCRSRCGEKYGLKV
jgi:hypothetical protein